MEVTSKNFEEKLPKILASIEDAIFVSIDGEFTGLSSKEDAFSALDTPSERFQKARNAGTKFMLIQFGLCTFHYDSKRKSYSNRAFNFYIFPRPSSRRSDERTFSSQPSSIDFLKKQNFDFNKVFYEGIPFLNAEEESKMRDEVEEKQDKRRQSNSHVGLNSTPTSGSGLVPIPDDQKPYLEEVLKRVESWFNATNDDIEKNFTIDRCNPFQRKLIYQSLRSKYGTSMFMETVDKGREKVISLTKMTSREIEEKEGEKDRLEKESIEVAMGFSKVIRKITSTGKLVVGHNMLLDLCFTINQFVTFLPESYSDFKLVMQASLPKVCDTKLMAHTTPFREEIRNSALEELLKTVSVDPYKLPLLSPDFEDDIAGYSISDSNEKFHEAGFDAFVTGLCFIAMSNRLGLLRDGVTKHIPPEDPLVESFINKLFMMMSQDIPYMNLTGKDIIPKRDNVFHITFPSKWTYDDIQNLFFPFGGVYIYWLTDTTAFVRLREDLKNASKVVKDTLKTSNLKTYAEFMSEKEPNIFQEKHLSTVEKVPVKSIGTKRGLKDENEEEPTTKKLQAFEEPPWE